MSETKKFNELFDYLSDPRRPDEAQNTLVFGRHDLRLVDAIAKLRDQGLARNFVITGGLGKDSGYLHKLQIPEATFLASAATAQPYSISPNLIRTETLARNGGENARLGLAVMDRWYMGRDVVTAVAHATSLRRLSATLEHEGSKLQPITHTVYRVGTDYPFNANNPNDQHEAVAEFMRLVDWPEKGWIQPQDDLPQDLIEFASDTKQSLGINYQQ